MDGNNSAVTTTLDTPKNLPPKKTIKLNDYVSEFGRSTCDEDDEVNNQDHFHRSDDTNLKFTNNEHSINQPLPEYYTVTSNNEEFTSKKSFETYYQQQGLNSNNYSNALVAKSESNASSLADNIAEFAQQNYIYSENIPISINKSNINLHQNEYYSSNGTYYSNNQNNVASRNQNTVTENYYKYNVPSYYGHSINDYRNNIINHQMATNSNYYNTNNKIQNYNNSNNNNNYQNYDMISNYNNYHHHHHSNNQQLKFQEQNNRYQQHTDYYSYNFNCNNYENKNIYYENYNNEQIFYKNDELSNSVENDVNYKLPKLSSLFPTIFKSQNEMNGYVNQRLQNNELNTAQIEIEDTSKQKQKRYKRKNGSKKDVTQITENDEGSFESVDADLNDVSRKKRGRPKKPLKKACLPIIENHNTNFNTNNEPQNYDLLIPNNFSDNLNNSPISSHIQNNQTILYSNHYNYNYNNGNNFPINYNNQDSIQSTNLANNNNYILQTGNHF